jgi:hypothetical protein
MLVPGRGCSHNGGRAHHGVRLVGCVGDHLRRVALPLHRGDAELQQTGDAAVMGKQGGVPVRLLRPTSGCSYTMNRQHAHQHG